MQNDIYLPENESKPNADNIAKTDNSDIAISFAMKIYVLLSFSGR